MNFRLEGGCQAPIAGHATLDGTTLHMTGLVAEPSGSEVLREEISGPVEQAAQLGETIAERLLDKGAKQILAKLYATPPE